MVNNYTESTNGLFISSVILSSLFITAHKSNVLVCRQCWHLFSVQVRCFMYIMNYPISRFPLYLVEFCFMDTPTFLSLPRLKTVLFIIIFYHYFSDWVDISAFPLKCFMLKLKICFDKGGWKPYQQSGQHSFSS